MLHLLQLHHSMLWPRRLLRWLRLRVPLHFRVLLLQRWVLPHLFVPLQRCVLLRLRDLSHLCGRLRLRVLLQRCILLRLSVLPHLCVPW